MRIQKRGNFSRSKLSILIAITSAGLVPSSFAQSNAASDEPLQLEGAEVRGSQQESRYYSPNASSATKTDTPILETPQNIQIMSSQMVEDIGALRLDDTLGYVSGIARQNSFGGLWDNFSIRGFSGDENTGPEVLRNGFAANRGFNASRDMANVERIEFLKGPASALYGRSDPGGTINIVTKRPQWSRAGTAKLSYGSYAQRRAELDLTGPATDTLAYRLNLAVEDNNSFRDTVESERQFVAPALTWRASDQTTFSYDGEFLRHKAPLDRGVVAVADKLGVVPVSRFLGEPGDGQVTIENQTHQFSMDHIFSADWYSRVAVGYKEGSLQGYSTEPSALIDGRTLRRQRRHRDNESTDYSLQAELFGTVQTGDVLHRLVFGADTYRFETDQVMRRFSPSGANPYAIDIFEPQYGQLAPEPSPNTDRFERQKAHALYLQNQMEFGDHWRVLAGARFDNYRQQLEDRRNITTRSQSQTATSPRLGVVYLANDQVSVYANASKSFRPNAGADVAGQAFDPEKGEALEIGIKAESLDGRIGGSLALFHIEKENVATADPFNPSFSIAAGEVESRGVELDVSGQLTAGLRVNVSYAYVDAEVTKDNTIPVGSRLLNVPRHSGSVLAVQDIGLGGFGAGLNYVGRRSGVAQDNGFELPAYTTMKVLGFYRVTPAVRLNLDVDNLFDRDHYLSSYNALWVTPGTRRTVTGSVEYNF